MSIFGGTPRRTGEQRHARHPFARLASMALALGLLAMHPPATAAACADGRGFSARITGIEGRYEFSVADGRRFVLAGILPGDEFHDAGSDSGAVFDPLPLHRVVTVTPVSARPDRWGRYPAIVHLGPLPVQIELARRGLALALPIDFGADCTALLRAAEAEARSRRAGLWGEPGRTVLPASTEALTARFGQFVVFEGAVVSVGNRRQRTYVDFGRQWQSNVTVEIERGDREAFGGAQALTALAGRTLRVRGYVWDRNGPAVKVRWPAQIEIVPPGVRRDREIRP